MDPHPGIDVTVLIATYNHARYIEAAIEGALAQKAAYSIEILISEDASTDGTREMVKRYAAAHPNHIRLLLSIGNVRSNWVVRRGLRAARGRYVALLDGDDFWTDNGKLQRQAAFLDAAPDCAAVFYNAQIAIGEQLTQDLWTRDDLPTRLSLKDILEGNPFATCTGMMRTDYVREAPAWYDDFFPITDWPLYILCAQYGNLAFRNETTGVYRLHEGGLHSALPKQAKLDAIEAFYNRLGQVIGAPLDSAVRGGCSRYFFDWAKASLETGDITAARSCFRRSLRGGGIGLSVSRREALRLALNLFCPAGTEAGA
jgi:glycosyltransferase involved in cell wall biosynthesis